MERGRGKQKKKEILARREPQYPSCSQKLTRLVQSLKPPSIGQGSMHACSLRTFSEIVVDSGPAIDTFIRSHRHYRPFSPSKALVAEREYHNFCLFFFFWIWIFDSTFCAFISHMLWGGGKKENRRRDIKRERKKRKKSKKKKKKDQSALQKNTL